MKKYPCPCCGYKTLKEKPPGTDIICRVCFWHDDYVQGKDVDFCGGANDLSLRDSQKNFLKFDAVEEKFIRNVRKPTRDEERDINWTPLADK